MAGCISHRGPDAGAVWVDESSAMALGHRRLSIVDLSSSGDQPMTSATGRFVVVFNGEIYNYRALRAELSGRAHHFRGGSDTEVLLAACEEWGVGGAVRRLAGMFAFGIWDRTERTLSLVRDRLGEKPLYFGWAGASLIFGSELKALCSHPHWQGEIDRSALTEFMRFAYIPAPWSIYTDFGKLVPGSIAEFRLGSGSTEPRVDRYWSALDVMSRGAANRLEGSDADLVGALDGELRRTLGEEMVADVPLGAFLSGGVDSSLIVAIMQACSTQKVRTFSIGFDIPGYNEAQHAKRVADWLGTAHTEHYVSAKDAMSVIEALPRIYDEPFADSSQIPTYLVSRMAREHVTVALSGDGGDEVFGGYNRYAWSDRIWNRASSVPMPLRRMVSSALLAMSPAALDALGRGVGAIVPGLRMRTPGDKAHKLARLLVKGSRNDFYREQLSFWSDPLEVLLGGDELQQRESVAAFDASGELTFIEQMMLHDLVGYLPGDILAKVDRAAMAVSLETRAPFLDHRLVEFAARLPFRAKVRAGRSKWILRELLGRYVPGELIERPKMGFAVPVHAWLRTDLRDWAEELLDPARLKREGFFSADVVRREWDLHLAGRINAVPTLWPVLMFQAWFTEQRAGFRAAA
jgi:asparagine synthase (glutamine-hydrolysing)